MFKRYIHRLSQFGGWRLVKEYVRMGLLGNCVKQFAKVLFGKEKPIAAYGKLQQKVAPVLRKKYIGLLKEKEKEYAQKPLTKQQANYVWVCWLQCLDSAPKVVKVCYNSLKKNLKDRKVVLLTDENIYEYVTLPEYDIKKHKQGLIPAAHFTDILRLQLLIEHGGTWIDATVLCTGDNYPRDLFESELFVFQHLEKEEKYEFRGLSSWFITSCINNRVLMVVRDLFLQYWKDYDCVTYYFMIHLFFCMVMEEHPEIAATMPRYNNTIPHYLSRRLGDNYDEEWMHKLKSKTRFHKLTYRLDDKVKREGTFYDVVINNAQS